MGFSHCADGGLGWRYRAASFEPLLISFAVAMWAGGFDIIYACTDYQFDREFGTGSVPSRIGIAEALWLARLMHFCAAAALLGLGVPAGAGLALLHRLGHCRRPANLRK